MKSKFFGALALFSVLVLGSCNITPSSSSIEPSTTDDTSDTAIDTSEESLPPWIDYAEDPHVRLSIDYKKTDGTLRDFVADGIAKVTLKSPIDGDTAHFYNPYKTIEIKTGYSNVVKSRFYGIDTPESTGKVQEWGKQASNYTKGILKNANENGTIVVTGVNYDHYEAPHFDSTGSRYLSLIWVNETKKDCDPSELKLLNLMIVQAGLSNVKNVSEVPDFADYMLAAEAQAKTYKLKMFSGELDPLFNYGPYQEADLLDIKYSMIETMENIMEYGSELDDDLKNPFDGANLKVYGVVGGFANNTMYISKFYSYEDGSAKKEGEYAGLNVYTGAATIPTKYRRYGTLIAIVGNFSYSEEFGMQVSGCTFPAGSAKADDESYIVTDEAEIKKYFGTRTSIETIEDTYGNLNARVANGTISNGNIPDDVLFMPVKSTTEVEVSSVYVSASSGDFSLTVKEVIDDKTLADENFLEIYIPFTFYGDPENHPTEAWNNKSYFIGKRFTVRGIVTSRWDNATSKYYYSITCRTEDHTDDRLPDLVCTSLEN